MATANLNDRLLALEQTMTALEQRVERGIFKAWIADVCLLAMDSKACSEIFVWDLRDPEWRRLYEMGCAPDAAVDIRFRGVVQ